MKRLSEMADKYGQEMSLGVKADEDSGLNNDQLTNFYSRYGFNNDTDQDSYQDTDMIRLPNLEASKKLPNIGYKELAKFLMQLGYQQVPGGKGEHQKWKHEGTGQMTVVKDPSAWGSNNRNVLEYILNNMGIPSKDFAKLWKDKEFRKDPLSEIDPNRFTPGTKYQNLMRQKLNQENQNQQNDEVQKLKQQADPNDPSDWRNYL